jgi:flagellar motor protein MotB
VTVQGRGAREPVAGNDTEAGRAANRRVEIFLSEPQA